MDKPAARSAVQPTFWPAVKVAVFAYFFVMATLVVP